MSIAINQSKCVGCGRCSQVCPGTLIGMGSDGKAGCQEMEEET